MEICCESFHLAGDVRVHIACRPGSIGTHICHVCLDITCSVCRCGGHVPCHLIEVFRHARVGIIHCLRDRFPGDIEVFRHGIRSILRDLYHAICGGTFLAVKDSVDMVNGIICVLRSRIYSITVVLRNRTSVFGGRACKFFPCSFIGEDFSSGFVIKSKPFRDGISCTFKGFLRLVCGDGIFIVTCLCVRNFFGQSPVSRPTILRHSDIVSTKFGKFILQTN